MPPKGSPSKTQLVDRKRMSDATTGGEGPEPVSPTVAGRVRAPGTRKEDWIGKHLRRVYDGAVEDAIPPQMLDLLNSLDDDDDDKPGEGSAG
jgi:hypothetical protein